MARRIARFHTVETLSFIRTWVAALWLAIAVMATALVVSTPALASESETGGVTPASSATVDPAPSYATLRLDSVAASVPADGVGLVTISGTIAGVHGEPLDRDADIMLTTSLGSFAGADFGPAALGFHVIARHGAFQAVLRAPTVSGMAIVNAYSGKVAAQTLVRFTTALRPNIAAGALDLHLGPKVSNFYAPFDHFLTNGSYAPYQLTAFTQGAIGQTQLTAALDNQAPINGDCSGLTPIYGSTHELTACRPKYPIYGDSSDAVHLANSSDNVYVRLEHNRDFVQWGDYDTSEFASLGQTYAALMTSFHGAKANYGFGKLDLTGLYATNMQAFQRDIIAPDGTSGAYYLSRRLVVPGSQSVSLELEKLDRPGTEVSVKRLVPGVDYDLNPISGSLLFRQPIERTLIDPKSGVTLVQHIVASYQYDGGQGADGIGGRLQYNWSGVKLNPSAFGISSFNENMGARKYALHSADIAVAQGADSRLLAEYAHSHLLPEASAAMSGDAYRVEEHIGGRSRFVGDAYVTHSDAGFANDATSQSFVPGQTRYALNTDDRASERTTLSLFGSLERDRGTAPAVLTSPVDYLNPGTSTPPGSQVDTRLGTIGASLEEKLGAASLRLALSANSYSNYLQPSLNTNSTQGLARVLAPLGPRFSALGEVDSTLSGPSTALYPGREALGVSYKVAEGVLLGATMQALHGGSFGDRHFTSLDAVVDRHLDKFTELTTKYSLVNGMGGFTAQQEIGLNSRLPISKHVRADIGYENATGSLFNLTAAGLQFAQPYAVSTNTAGLGITGGTSYHVGAELIGVKDFLASARLEQSASSYGTNTVVHVSAAGIINVANKLLASYDREAAANQLLGGMPPSSELNVGFALRDPRADNHNWLLSYQFQDNPGLLPTQLLTPGQIVQQNQLLANRNIVAQAATVSIEGIEGVSPRFELYGKFATRNQRTQVSPAVTSGSTIQFLQARARYLIGQRYDVSGELRQILSNSGGFHESGFVWQAGYLTSPETRAALGFSGGKIDQTVFDSGREHNGVFLDFTMRIHQLWRHD
ncbi:MAG: hypothetical protein DLM53_00340 [Candidatus Eremiobacter antarcticus]|nr:MAG: hypothetical protein DLM53_00340 [Candidatus Eremiobacter sp. RRmetagenome_bin22]